jgi:hypothetical protein
MKGARNYGRPVGLQKYRHRLPRAVNGYFNGPFQRLLARLAQLPAEPLFQPLAPPTVSTADPAA